MMGNCCLSSKFDTRLFWRKYTSEANKGAVGYIGGSNNTYWDEDYWWGVGYETVVVNPLTMLPTWVLMTGLSTIMENHWLSGTSLRDKCHRQVTWLLRRPDQALKPIIGKYITLWVILR